MTSRITEHIEDDLLFVNNKEGIIETALNRKTLTDPADPAAVRELLHIFIERVEVFEDKHGIIYYDLPVRSAGPEGTPAKETIYFDPKKGLMAPKSCGFDGRTGVCRGGVFKVSGQTKGSFVPTNYLSTNDHEWFD